VAAGVVGGDPPATAGAFDTPAGVGIVAERAYWRGDDWAVKSFESGTDATGTVLGHRHQTIAAMITSAAITALRRVRGMMRGTRDS
jgi:hypothetical protein